MTSQFAHLTTIGADSTGQRENASVLAAQPGQKQKFLTQCYFAQVEIPTPLSYTKMMKIATTRSIFATKTHRNAFAAADPAR